MPLGATAGAGAVTWAVGSPRFVSSLNNNKGPKCPFLALFYFFPSFCHIACNLPEAFFKHPSGTEVGMGLKVAYMGKFPEALQHKRARLR